MGIRVKVGEQFSEGARLLWQELQRKGWNQTDLTKRLEAPRGVVNHWLWGTRRPARKWASKIQKAFRIDAALWDADPKRAFRPPIVTQALAAERAARASA